MKIINFISNRAWLDKESKSQPVPISKSMPQWYKEADRFVKDSSGEYEIGRDKNKIPTWKACPAILDILTTGYTFVTPCDVEFFINDNGQIDVKIKNVLYKDFVTTRPPMEQFHHPEGYYKHHFAWMPEWSIKVPDGYSVLYVSPINRYDLPIMTTSGIIDNDKVNFPGSIPFFLQEGWTGVLPAGTPYAQIIPFLRENWKSEITITPASQIVKNKIESGKKYRVPNGGVYQKEVWTRRIYE
jgi:hypothetical protein